jgi:hypothetical protein
MAIEQVPDLTSAPSDAVNQQMRKLNKGRTQPLTRFQQKQISEAKPVYIYNVSTIHKWERFQGQLGTVVIPKCDEGERVSKPYIVKGVIARWYDKGLGRKEAFLEEGLEVAEDIVGCSKEYPVENLNNNLMTFGVFITRKPFEELSQREQDRVLEEATEKYINKLRDIILQADGLYAGDDNSKKGIGSIHREALRAFNQIEGSKEDRPWAPVRHAAKSVDCPFCGISNKPHVAKCANCHEIINQELYDKLKKAVKE